MSTQTTQIIAYISRNPSLSPSEFYKYWTETHAAKVAPWAEKHGILLYQQIHTSGLIVPNLDSNSAPNVDEDVQIPTTPQPYDGIAMFEVTSLEAFREAFKDPYFVEVIEPDERILIDKGGFARGIVASFSGRLVKVVEEGKSVLTREKAGGFRKEFEEFEKK